MNAILQDLPLPARLLPWPREPLTTVQRCLLLALLLHVWLVLWLGNAPGGTAPQGQGVSGGINVTLRGPVTEGATAVVLPPAPANGMPSKAAAPRWGGAVRSSEPLPGSAPGAERLGESAAPTPAAPQPFEAPRLPSPLPATPEPAAAEGRLAATAPWRASAATQPLPAVAPLPSVDALPAIAATPALIAVPRPVPQLNSPLIDAPAPAPAAPLPRAELAPTLPEPAAPPAPALAEAPPPLRRLQAQPVAPRAPEPSLSRQPEALALPAPAELPSTLLPTARPGAAEGGAQVGRDIATPPAAAASAVPRLNLELARPRGGELSRYSTSGVLPVLPRPPERDDKLAKKIEKAGKGDCRSAYSGMGPLAVIPLAADALRKDGGCKW